MTLPNQVLLVVARYLENIDWLKPYSSQCLIVNKGWRLEPYDSLLLAFPNVIRQENIGRESHTYLLFIIKNYHCLPDIIIFTQGRIHDHFSESAPTLFERFIHQVVLYGASLPTHTHLGSDPSRKSSWDPDWNVYDVEEIHSDDSKKNVTRFVLEDCYLDNNKIRFDIWFQNNIGRPYTFPFKVYKSAIFSVHKNKVLSRPLSFYENLIRFCSHHIDPAEGHFIERSWYYIFNDN